MRNLAIAILTVFLIAPTAEATTIYLGAWSKHLDDGQYNERHDLVAVEHNRWIAGTLINSYGDRTYLAGKGWDLATTRNWNFRVYAGASYGYYACDGTEGGDKPKVCPALVPELSFTKYRIKPALMLFGGALAVSFKVEI